MTAVEFAQEQSALLTRYAGNPGMLATELARLTSRYAASKTRPAAIPPPPPPPVYTSEEEEDTGESDEEQGARRLG